MNLWQCPHPSLFLQEICAALDTLQTHCFVSMPARLIPSFQQELTSRWNSTVGRLPLALLDEKTALVDVLSPMFDTDAESPSLPDLKEGMPMGARTLAVVLPEHLCAAERELFRFLRGDLAAHAKKCRDDGEYLNWNLLVIAPADREVPDEDIGLRCFCWWGRLRRSDMEYAMEDTFRESFGPAAAQERLNLWWLRPLCRGLAATDPELVETIYQYSPIDMDTLMVALADHELCTEENGKLVEDFLDGASYTPARGARPRDLAAKLWHRGLLDLNGEGDVFLHPAGLLAAGRRDDLEHLVVRGQMQFFLPLVHEVHSLLRRAVEKLLKCPLEDCLPADGHLDAAIYEIGPLIALLSHLHKNRGWKVPDRILHAAKRWSAIRNTMAHFHMLPIETVREALTLYEGMLREGGAAAHRPG